MFFFTHLRDIVHQVQHLSDIRIVENLSPNTCNELLL